MPTNVRTGSQTLNRSLETADRTGWKMTLLGLFIATGCATGPAPPRPMVIPPISQASVATPTVTTIRLPNGLSVVHSPRFGDPIQAGLFFAGGSIDNPTTYTGLTSFLSHAGLTSSLNDNLNPMSEALTLGSSIKAKSDNTVFGWTLHGASTDVEQLLGLLRRVGTRQGWDEQEMQLLAKRSADQLTSLLDPGVQQALAVAVGSALGLSKPKALYGHADHVRRFGSDIVRKHWQRMVRPRRGVLVVQGGNKEEVIATAARLFKDWRPKLLRGQTEPSCWPDRPTSHLVVDPSATTRRIYTVLALRVPSPGDPGREAIETALEAFGRVPGGRLAKVLGESRARDISPHIVDLGWNNGEKGSVLLMRLSGPSRETLRALWDVIETVHGVGARPPTGEELERAKRHLTETRDNQHSTPFAALRNLATKALYGGDKVKETDFEAHVQAIFRRRNISVIGVGPNPLGPVLGELGTLTVWDSGGLILEGNNRAACP